MLRDSPLYIQAERNILLTEPTDLTGGYKIRPLLIGCGAYPAITWLVKPFSDHLIYPKDRKNLTGFYLQQVQQ